MTKNRTGANVSRTTEQDCSANYLLPSVAVDVRVAKSFSVFRRFIHVLVKHMIVTIETERSRLSCWALLSKTVLVHSFARFIKHLKKTLPQAAVPSVRIETDFCLKCFIAMHKATHSRPLDWPTPSLSATEKSTVRSAVAPQRRKHILRRKGAQQSQGVGWHDFYLLALAWLAQHQRQHRISWSNSGDPVQEVRGLLLGI